MNKKPLLFMGGTIALLIIVLIVILYTVKKTSTPTSPDLVIGNSYTVRVDPYSDSPVGSLFIILLKKNGVVRDMKVDPVYEELAKQTGGSVNVIDPARLQGDELADHMTAVMLVDLYRDTETLFATGTIATGGELGLTVYMPNGNMYTAKSKDNAESTMFNIQSPVPGEWKIVVSGEGEYEMHVATVDDKDFYKVEFVELGGRPGHQGLFSITHELHAGENATLRAVALSDITDLKAYYKLSSQKLVEFTPASEADTLDEFYFKGVVPSGSFTILLRWVDVKTQSKMEREFYPTTVPI